MSKHVRAIAAGSSAQAFCAARAVFECRLLAGELIGDRLDRKLYDLEMALYRVASEMKPKPRGRP